MEKFRHIPCTRASARKAGYLFVALVVANLVSTEAPTQAFSVKGRHVVGFIQNVDAQAREAELVQPGKPKPLRFTWDQQTKFLTRLQLCDARVLRPGVLVEIVCYHPFFGDTYVTRVTLLSRSLLETQKNSFVSLPGSAARF
jgi:hypothetical protein